MWVCACAPKVLARTGTAASSPPLTELTSGSTTFRLHAGRRLVLVVVARTARVAVCVAACGLAAFHAEWDCRYRIARWRSQRSQRSERSGRCVILLRHPQARHLLRRRESGIRKGLWIFLRGQRKSTASATTLTWPLAFGRLFFTQIGSGEGRTIETIENKPRKCRRRGQSCGMSNPP